MTTASLKRELGISGATMMGLGSIIGTGVFVSIGIAAGITGPSVILAVMVGAVVALFNGLSSAQLAASHPVAGGSYEYGYKYLNPALGFTAGWLFLLAKSASAATAALGFAAYLTNILLLSRVWLVPLALAVVMLLTVIVFMGLRRSNQVNTFIVSLTLLALFVFILLGFSNVTVNFAVNLQPFWQDTSVSRFFYACALMFVAYTGYGRIATMGEEVVNPQRTIPRAIISTLVLTMLLYSAVAVVAVATVGAPSLGTFTLQQAAPLESVAKAMQRPLLPQLIALAAMTAMLGVLLNLILGLSRVLMAMGRRKDMPVVFARLNSAATTPSAAVIMMGVVIAGLVLIGNVALTWSFSAFTVLIYYAITNLAALQLPSTGRLYPRWIAVMGLASCLGLAFFVPPSVWLAGLGLILLGLVWQQVAARWKLL